MADVRAVERAKRAERLHYVPFGHTERIKQRVQRRQLRRIIG